MRSDFITKPLPKSVLIDGVTYPVNCDFRIGIQFENVRKGKGSDAEKLIRLLRLYYPVRIPPDIGKALDRIIWFYRCGEEKEKEEKKERYQRRGSKDPAYSFSLYLCCVQRAVWYRLDKGRPALVEIHGALRVFGRRYKNEQDHVLPEGKHFRDVEERAGVYQ